MKGKFHVTHLHISMPLFLVMCRNEGQISCDALTYINAIIFDYMQK